MFIVFEGIDGSGKTTQAKLLAEKLKAFFTYEPTDGDVGKLIRAILREKRDVDNRTLALLFAADRIEHNKIIKKELKKRDVVCDRYFYSSLAYQSVSGVDEDFIKNINRYIIEPDITFLLIIDIEKALERKNKDMFENKDFLEKVQNKYLELAKEYNFIVIDANRDVEEIHRDILKHLSKHLP
ncbi:thymidylate kinase [Methanocaldococcus villosus KIN24-T80]|uniref:Probable thymidylate kinase n=1 Tax=Methanocaldococcus villosus KIN24-T80 TaxID=1069083 RepID=N6VSC1_9EURY|nr:dTMP kinase [Methanocaldococcus villosus]ENN96775.1 thymidylate kinase [Methanocaldococcus villosus KIN24-T80]